MTTLKLDDRDDASHLWQEGKAKTVTFIVTKECQLRCKYCYMTGKHSHARMPFDIAKRTVDYLLSNRDLLDDKSVIWEFIGGEPFLEIALIDNISDYIKRRMFELDHPWFDRYRFNFTTNGLLYDDAKVQRYISKNKTHIDIGITIDGTKIKHDMNRIFPNGRGSYERVVPMIPLWLKQFPQATTKVTVSSEDIPYIKESVLHIWELGIKHININCVFEDVWQKDDDKRLEDQLISLADEIIENRWYEEHSCSFFSKTVGMPLDCVQDNKNWCGAGIMLSVDHLGNFYPCTRYVDYCLQNKEPLIVGNCYDGVDTNRLRPFLTLDRTSQSTDECIYCDVASGCAWCQAANYDYADTTTNFQRATFICKMHKARAKANRYYWSKLAQENG